MANSGRLVTQAASKSVVPWAEDTPAAAPIPAHTIPAKVRIRKPRIDLPVSRLARSSPVTVNANPAASTPALSSRQDTWGEEDRTTIAAISKTKAVAISATSHGRNRALTVDENQRTFTRAECSTDRTGASPSPEGISLLR